MAKQFFCNCSVAVTKTSNHNEAGHKCIISGILRFVTSTWRGNNIFVFCSFSQAIQQKHEWLKRVLTNEKRILD